MKFNLDKVLETLVGKKFVSLEFDMEAADRAASVGKVITQATSALNESREDAGIRLTFEDETFVFVYDNEDIEVE